MRTKVGSAAAVLVALAAVGACGSGSSASGGARLTASGIAQETSAGGSARLEMRQSQLRGAAGGAAAATQVDFRNHRGEARSAPGGPEVAEVRWIGTHSYARVLPSPGGLATTGRWFESGPGAGDDQLHVNPMAAFLFSQDPLGLLRATPARARTVGHETVRGVPTTHLRVDLDFRALTKQLRAEGYTVDDPPTATQPAELWVDAQGRLRRLRSTDVTSDPPAATTLELFDFGVRVDVQAPPADQITHGESSSSASSGVVVAPTRPSHR
jgi:hypothetical protein